MSETLYFSVGKRWFDGAVAFIALILLSPLFLATAVVIKVTSRGPVFFRQLRVGQFGGLFQIIKFRTMITLNGPSGSALTAAGDPRITTLGRWLRRTKIDELPQLINVLWGDMSLVGPRPEVPEYTASYTDRQRQIFKVKPGITGPAANNYIDEEQLLAGHADKEIFYLRTILPVKLEYDIAYCGGVRFRKDLLILLKTFTKVSSRFVVPGKLPPRMPENQN